MSTPLLAPYALTRYDSFQVILDECPRAGELLAEYGLHCANCFMNGSDTVENGAEMHGMSEAEMIEMLHEINTQLEQEWRKQNT
jgi:hypothetical protein